jgi:hypothetical protein
MDNSHPFVDCSQNPDDPSSIIEYEINGQMFGTSHTFILSYSLAGYYPTLDLMGIDSASIFLFIYIQSSENSYDTSELIYCYR